MGIIKILMQNLIIHGFLWGILEIGWDHLGLPWHLPMIIYAMFVILQIGTAIFCLCLLRKESLEKPIEVTE